MRVHSLVYAAIVAVMMPVAALADDPFDPAMRDAAARARDREMTRRLNLQELATVRERDARYAQGWRAHAGGRSASADTEHSARSRDYERARADYARERSRYERDMADWRGAVAACRDGNYSACDN